MIWSWGWTKAGIAEHRLQDFTGTIFRVLLGNSHSRSVYRVEVRNSKGHYSLDRSGHEPKVFPKQFTVPPCDCQVFPLPSGLIELQ